MKIILVGFLSDGHGCSCEMHPYGCGNALLANADNGGGRLVHLRLVRETNLACYVVQDDGTDDCRVCFAVREYAIGNNARRLDGMLLMITQVFLPDSENRSMRTSYHCNHGYAYAETIDN